MIRTRVYAHLGQKDYKEVVDLIRQQIISAAGINEEATKIIDEEDPKRSARASEDCGEGENKELDELKRHKEAIDHQKDLARENKKKEADEARKKAEQHRGTLVR